MDMLKLRKELKSRKPKFRMTGYRERKSVKDRWRHAKGNDNKIRQGLKGYPKKVKIGYGSPKAARGLHQTGMAIIFVRNVNEVNKADPKIHGIYISSTVGKKKKVEIIKKCIELKIKILNYKNAEDYIKKVDAEIKAKKEEKDKKKGEKEKKKIEKEKKAAEKEKKEKKQEEKSEEGLAEKVDELKEKEEKEKQKVLTKKE